MYENEYQSKWSDTTRLQIRRIYTRSSSSYSFVLRIFVRVFFVCLNPCKFLSYSREDKSQFVFNLICYIRLYIILYRNYVKFHLNETVV